MRQRQWLKLVKDYDIEILYHLGKANVVADALSRKAVHTSVMISTQEILQDEMKRAGIDVVVKGGNVQMAQLTIQPTLQKKIIDAQRSDEHLSKVWSQTETERPIGYSISSDGGLLWQNRLCIPRDEGILKDIMTEAHDISYVFHPGSTMMYQDLKRYYWWSGMNRNIADFVSRCLTCQQVKAPRQRRARLLQPLNVPQWKWEAVCMDFVSGLSKTKQGFNIIWVIVDRLTKTGHFIPRKSTYRVDWWAQLYIKEIVRLHRVPVSIVSDRDTRFTSQV